MVAANALFWSGRAYFTSPSIGAPMATQWTRNWCVRPVSGLQLQPGQLLPGVVQRAVVGDGAGGFLVVTLGDFGAFATGATDAAKRQVDAALDRDRPARGHRPVGLLHRAGAERGGQLCRSAWCRRQQQHAGGVAIQPMHQPRPLGRAEAQCIQHSVEVVRDARTALHRHAVRLVQHQHVVVPVDQQALEIAGGVGVDLGPCLWR